MLKKYNKWDYDIYDIYYTVNEYKPYNIQQYWYELIK